jgi:hypothetical protein
MFHDETIRAIRANSPSQLLVQSTMLNRAGALMEAFSAASPNAPLLLPGTTAETLRNALRTHLSLVMHVSPGLLPFMGDVGLDRPDGYVIEIRPPLPVRVPGRKARHARFNVIIECTEAKLWYSRDNANHSRSGVVAFKCFTESATGLRWEADLDENGIRITGKHKGPVGLFIPWGELNFENPQRPKTGPNESNAQDS